MSIITGRGDDGHTDLLFGRRVTKTSPRVEALGAVDELNTALGVARVAGLNEEFLEWVDIIQDTLVGLMGLLACLPEDMPRYTNQGLKSLGGDEVKFLEEKARSCEARGIRFTGWARPGEDGSIARAALDHARAVGRRAERAVLLLHEDGGAVPEEVRLYLNRLSDLLWILARAA